ncbi:MAG: FHA domain-containing protein, partial [Kiritimatiellia bacterium]
MASHLLELEIRQNGTPLQKHPVAFGVYPVGSETGNKIVIPDKTVAARHAILLLREDGLWVEDLNSPGATLLNGVPVRGRAGFRPGQPIRLGNFELVVHLAGTAPPPPPQVTAPTTA